MDDDGKKEFRINVDTSRLLLPGEKASEVRVLPLDDGSNETRPSTSSAVALTHPSTSEIGASNQCASNSHSHSSHGSASCSGSLSTSSGSLVTSSGSLVTSSGSLVTSSADVEEREPLVSRSGSGVRKVASHPKATSWNALQQTKMVRDEDEDLEGGVDGQPQCRICLESDGRDFIAPCKCKGSSQFVHRECLDQWRSIKEGFAFAHCTTCKMQYHIRVHAPLDAKWRTMKFRFFVTRDALAITMLAQALICFFGFLVYSIDSNVADFKLKHAFKFESNYSFYYLCDLMIFFFMAGLLGCIFTCIDRRFRTDIGGPCRELCTCCFNPLIWGDCHCCGPLCFYTDCSMCAECAGASTECLASGGVGEAGAMFFVTLGTVVLMVFAVVGIFYSLVVAAVVAQRIWQRHYHILAKRMLTKEYVVEDLAGQDLTSYTPPPLPPEHEKQLRDLGLLESR